MRGLFHRWLTGALIVTGIGACEEPSTLTLTLPTTEQHRSAAIVLDDGQDITVELVSLNNGQISEAFTQNYEGRYEITVVLWNSSLRDLGFAEGEDTNFPADVMCPLPETGATIWQATVDGQETSSWSSQDDLPDRVREVQLPCGLPPQFPVCHSVSICGNNGELRTLLPLGDSPPSVLLGFRNGTVAQMESDGACTVVAKAEARFETGYRDPQGRFWFGTTTGTILPFDTTAFEFGTPQPVQSGRLIRRIGGTFELYAATSQSIFQQNTAGQWQKVYDLHPVTKLGGIASRTPGVAVFGLSAIDGDCFEGAPDRFSGCPSSVSFDETSCPPITIAEQWSQSEPISCFGFPPFVVNHAVTALARGLDGTIWAGSRLGAAMFLRPGESMFQQVPITSPEQSETQNIISTDSRVWFFHERGEIKTVFNDVIIQVGFNDLTTDKNWRYATITGADKIVGDEERLLWYIDGELPDNRACP